MIKEPLASQVLRDRIYADNMRNAAALAKEDQATTWAREAVENAVTVSGIDLTRIDNSKATLTDDQWLDFAERWKRAYA